MLAFRSACRIKATTITVDKRQASAEEIAHTRRTRNSVDHICRSLSHIGKFFLGLHFLGRLKRNLFSRRFLVGLTCTGNLLQNLSDHF